MKSSKKVLTSILFPFFREIYPADEITKATARYIPKSPAVPKAPEEWILKPKKSSARISPISSKVPIVNAKQKEKNETARIFPSNLRYLKKEKTRLKPSRPTAIAFARFIKPARIIKLE